MNNIYFPLLLVSSSSKPSAEIPLYHILNARITFSNLNGCEEGLSIRTDNEVGMEGDGQRDGGRTETPSPGSDSSSVSSSSSTSESQRVSPRRPPFSLSLSYIHILRFDISDDFSSDKRCYKSVHLLNNAPDNRGYASMILSYDQCLSPAEKPKLQPPFLHLITEMRIQTALLKSAVMWRRAEVPCLQA